MSIVIDFEGFQLVSGHFIVKELAYAAANSIGVWTFQPPYPHSRLSNREKVQYSWVTRNLHQIHWNEGELPYCKLRIILNSLFDLFPNIYVKGLEKKIFLEFLSGRECYNLTDLSCPKIKNFIPLNCQCPTHGIDFPHCALVKATAFAKYLKSL